MKKDSSSDGYLSSIIVFYLFLPARLYLDVYIIVVDINK
jgi:hypothetical protein